MDGGRRHYQHYVSGTDSITSSNEVVVEKVKDRHFWGLLIQYLQHNKLNHIFVIYYFG